MHGGECRRPRAERRDLAASPVQRAVAERPGGDREPPLVEAVHRDLEPLPLLADEVLDRYLDVLEEELAGRTGPDAELVLLVAGGESRHPLLEHERTDPFVRAGGVGLR